MDTIEQHMIGIFDEICEHRPFTDGFSIHVTEFGIFGFIDSEIFHSSDELAKIAYEIKNRRKGKEILFRKFTGVTNDR